MLLPLLALFASFTYSADCGVGEWFRGFRGGEVSADFTISFYEPNSGVLWMGGSATGALALLPGTEMVLTEDTAALMLIIDDADTIAKDLFVIDKVTHPSIGDILVTGVAAIHASDGAEVLGVFQAHSEYLIMFLFEVPSRGSGLEIFMID